MRMRLRLRLLAGLALALCAITATADQPLRPPQIAPFGDGDWWVLIDPIPTRIGVSTEIITVPKGFVTDLASIPRIFWSAFPKTGPYMSAAMLHDYLYWDQRCSRAEADRIFDIEMKSYGVNDTSRKLIFAAVSEFGAQAWEANAARKKAGEPRFMPEDLLTQYLSQPFDASRSWQAIRAQIGQQAAPIKVSGDPNDDLAGACSRALAANASK